MKRVIEMLVDDLDGSEAERTVTLTFDGSNYSIDLSGKNAEKLFAALAPFTHAARRVGKFSAFGPYYQRGPAIPRRSTVADKRAWDQAIRIWAKEQGYPVADRGRIAQTVIDAYENRDRHKDHFATDATDAAAEVPVQRDKPTGAAPTPAAPAVPVVAFSGATGSANGVLKNVDPQKAYRG